MTSRTRTTLPILATQTPGSHRRVPKTMPATYADYIPFSFASMAGETNGNFSSISSSSGSRQYQGSKPAAFSFGPYPDSDNYFLSVSGMTYPLMSMTDSPFVVPVMSSMSGYDADLTSEFLMENALSANNSADATFVPSRYPGQSHSQDYTSSGFMSRESPLYPVGMIHNCYSAEFSPPRLPTPPPEENLQDCLSAHVFQEQLCLINKDFTLCEADAACCASSDRSEPLPLYPFPYAP